MGIFTSMRHGLLALAVCASLTACSDSNNSPPPPQPAPPPPTDTTAPSVTNTVPDTGESSVARDSTVAVTFSEAMDAATIDTGSLTLTDDASSSAVAGSVSYDAASTTATFTPASNLALAADYTATIAATIADEAGNTLAGPETIRFSTADGSIATETLLSSLYCDETDVTVDAGGNAIVVCRSEDDTDPFADNIAAFRYAADSDAFTAAVTVDTGSADAEGPRIAGDADGNAIVVWAQPNASSGFSEVLASRYDAGTDSWSAPVVLSDATLDAFAPDIGMAASGDALAIWEENDGSNPGDIVFAVFDTAAGSWSAGSVVDDSAQAAFNPRIAVNDSGLAVAAWEQDTAPGAFTFDAVASVYDGTGWSVPETLDDRDASVRDPQVGIDASGTALVAWQQEKDDGSFVDDALAAVFDPGTSSWAAPVEVDGTTNSIDDPLLAMSARGTAFIVYEENAPGGSFNTVASVRYEAGSFDAAVTLSDGSDSARDVTVASDPRGNALAVWIQADELQGSRYRYEAASNTWSAPFQVGFDTQEIGDPAVALGVNGDGAVGWTGVDASTFSGNVFN